MVIKIKKIVENVIDMCQSCFCFFAGAGWGIPKFCSEKNEIFISENSYFFRKITSKVTRVQLFVDTW